MINLSYYFTNYSRSIWGHASYIFDTGRRISGTVCIFCLGIARVTLLGIGRQGGLSSHISPDVSIRVDILTIGVVYFYKAINPTPWYFGEKIEGCDVLLRVYTKCWCVQIVWRGVKICWQTWWRFPCKLARSFYSDICIYIRSFLWVSVIHTTAPVWKRSCRYHYRSLFTFWRDVCIF